MQLRILQNVITGGRVLEPGLGNFDPVFAQHLLDIGVAERFETKIVEDIYTKKPDMSALQQGQVSRKKIVKKSKSKLE